MSVSPRFIHVGLNFSGTPNVEEIEKSFSLALDWVRYDIHCWILYSNTELDIWRDRIRNLSCITANDSFFLCEFERSRYSGYQQKMVWDFLNKVR